MAACVRQAREPLGSALHDLLLVTGVLDDRIPQAAAGPRLQHRLDRPTLLVGIHARRQQTGDDDPRSWC